MSSYFTKLLIIFLLGSLLVPIAVKGGAVVIENPLGTDSMTDLIDKIISIIWYLSVVIAPIMITVAGFYFVTSMGDPQKVATAKKIILWVLIGLLITTSAKGIIELFQEIFLKKTT